MKIFSVIRLTALSLSLSLGGLLPLTASAQTPGEVPIGGVLRNVPMRGLTTNGTMLSDYRGKPLIINIWASYCPPCLAEMGSLERLHQRHGKQFNLIGISIDDYADRALGFLAKTKTSFPHYIDHQLTLENMLGGNRVPLTLLIDANGKVIDKTFGAQEWDSPASVKTIAQAFKLKL